MADYYVSENGSDSNSGTSTSAPLRGIQTGINKLAAGDSLHIMNGTYLPGDEDLDYWLVANLHGTSSKEITIQAYTGHSPVLSGAESGAGSGYPQTDLEVHKKSITWQRVTYKITRQALVEIRDCAYLTLDGLAITNSLGHLLTVRGTVQNDYGDEYVGSGSEGTKAATAHHLTFTNCTLHNSRQRNMFVKNVWDININSCELSFGSWALKGGSGGPQFQNSFYIFFDDNYVHHQCGETFVTRNNNRRCRNVYVRNNVWWDNEDGVYVTGVSKAVLSGNFIYRTPQDANAQKPIGKNVAGIGVRTAECDQDLKYGVNHGAEYVLVNNNVLVNLDEGIKIKVDPPESNVGGENPTSCKGYQPKPMDYVYVVNNTVVNSTKVNYRFATSTGSDCIFKNNISLNDVAKNHIKTNYATNAQLAGWDADRNLYGGSDPESYIKANLKGGNDLYDSDPSLLDDSPPTKGAVTELSKAGYWVNFNKKTGFDDANGFRIPTGSTAEDEGETLAAPAGWNSDSYDDDMSDWIDVEFDFAKSGTNPSRSGTWDIGAHEYGVDGGGAPPAISAITVETAASYDAVIDESLDFATTAAGGTGALSYLWDFGDGETSTTEDPTHTYEELGYYVVRLTVTDSKGLNDTDTVAVNVTRDIDGGNASVTVEQVLVSAGAASYAVSAAPKAIFMMMTGATTDDTLVDGTLLSAGVWSNDGEQLAAAISAKHSAGTTVTRSINVNDGVLHFLQETVNWADVATVDSVSASAVNMTWPTANNGEKIITWNFYGDDVTNPQACEVSLGSENSTVKITGDYNRLIMPASLGASASSTRRGVFSLGVAARDGNTVSHTYQNKNDRSSTDIVSSTRTDRVAYRPSLSTYAIIDAWDSSGITFKVLGGDVNEFVPALLMNVSGAEWGIGVFETPTATGNNDFDDAADVSEGTPEIDGQVIWTFGSIATSYDSDITDDAAGVFNFHAADDTNDYTLSVTSDNANTVSDESSYYSDAWDQRDCDGSSEATGAIALLTPADGFRIAPTTAAATAYKNAYVLFEATTAVSSIAADLDYYLSGTNPADDEPIYAGDTVQMKDLSAPSSGNALDTWTWDYGDGSTDGTTQDPTHVYAQAGTYTITLTVDDDASAGPVSNTKDITVLSPAPTIDFDINEDITPTAGTGTAPLSCTIDGSSITAGTGETIDHLVWVVEHNLVDSGDSDLVYGPLRLEFVVQPDDAVSFSIPEAGTYSLSLEVYYTNQDQETAVGGGSWREAWTVAGSGSMTTEITSDVGQGRVPVGPYDVTFTVKVDGKELTDASDYASISWNFGDTNTSVSWQPTNTYAAVSSTAAYTVSVTVTGHDGETYTDSITDYITLYPAPTAPPTLADLMERLENLLAIDYFDDSWTQGAAPNTNTYYQTNSMPWGNGSVRVTEDGIELDVETTAAAVQANPGSFLIVYSSPTLTVRLHPFDSSNPNTNGKTYRWLY